MSPADPPRGPAAAEEAAELEALAQARRVEAQDGAFLEALLAEVERRVLAMATTTQVVEVVAYDPDAPLPVTVRWLGADLPCGHAAGYTPTAEDLAVMHMTGGFPVVVDRYVGTPPEGPDGSETDEVVG